MFGYGGNILHVNLTDGNVTRSPTEADLVRLFLGGRGLNVKRLFDEVSDATEALSPDNRLIFGVGPFVGTSVPGGSRFNVTGISPQTGILGDSNAGGFFGPELKYAGYDQLVIEGKASHPVYLWIRDEVVELRDARGLWGKDVSETTMSIHEELGDGNIQVATVGQAAENGVLFAGIIVNQARAAARTGIGTLMAAKNLKAIAIRGTQPIRVADISRFTELIAELDDRIYGHDEYAIRYRLGTTKLVLALNKIGGMATRHFQTGQFEEADKVSGEAIELQYKSKTKGCFACTIPCSRYLVIKDARFPELQMEGPEYEPLAGFTSRIGNGDLALGLKCVDLSNRYGMDAIAVSECISWAMECYELGILTREDADGLDLSWGNGEAILALVDKIAYRQGFGDLLADGAKKAAEKIGQGSEELVMHSKGLEVFQADPRAVKAYALCNAVSSRGADHLRAEPWFEFSGDGAEGLRRYGVAESAFRLEYKGKGHVVKHFEELAAISDATGFCKNTYNNMEVLSWDQTADLLNATTGWALVGEDVRAMGERIVNLERVFLNRRGITRADDTLPRRFLEEPLGPATSPSAGSVVELEPMLNEYYALRGWDNDTGVPTAEKLEELQLINAH